MAWHSLSQNCTTVDEGAHLLSGVLAWQQGEVEYYYVNPPLIKLITSLPMVMAGIVLPHVPWNAGTDIYEYNDLVVALNSSNYGSLLFRSRCVNVALSVVGGWVLFLWGRKLFGSASGIVGAALWFLCPTVIGWAGVCTVDLGASIAGLAAMYILWIYIKNPRMFTASVAGSVLGLSLVSKFTLLMLCPIAVLALIAVGRTHQRLGANVRARHIAFGMSLAIITINCVYGFNQTMRPIGEIRFRSHMLRFIATSSWVRDTWVTRIPLPIPASYIRGLDEQKSFADRIITPRVYLRGQWRCDAWRYYYRYVLFVKLPLGTLMLALLALWLMIVVPSVRKSLWEELMLLGSPAAIIAVVTLNMRNQFSSVRYILPALPFLFISIGRVGMLFEESWTQNPLRTSGFSRRTCLAASGVVLSALLWNGVSDIRVHPHELSYFNEIVHGPDCGWEHLIESNVDWGQDLLHLNNWLEAHPEARPLKLAYYGGIDPHVIGIEYQLAPTMDEVEAVGLRPGWYAISVNFIAGAGFRTFDEHGTIVEIEGSDYEYVKLLNPVFKAGYSIFVYHVGRDEAAAIRDWGKHVVKQPSQ
jgi:hypothetical protein